MRVDLSQAPISVLKISNFGKRKSYVGMRPVIVRLDMLEVAHRRERVVVPIELPHPPERRHEIPPFAPRMRNTHKSSAG